MRSPLNQDNISFSNHDNVARKENGRNFEFIASDSKTEISSETVSWTHDIISDVTAFYNEKETGLQRETHYKIGNNYALKSIVILDDESCNSESIFSDVSDNHLCPVNVSERNVTATCEDVDNFHIEGLFMRETDDDEANNSMNTDLKSDMNCNNENDMKINIEGVSKEDTNTCHERVVEDDTLNLTTDRVNTVYGHGNESDIPTSSSCSSEESELCSPFVSRHQIIETANNTYTQPSSSMLYHPNKPVVDREEMLVYQKSSICIPSGIEHSVNIIDIKPKSESHNQYHDDRDGKCMLQNVSNAIMMPILTHKSPRVESMDPESGDHNRYTLIDMEGNENKMVIDEDNNNINLPESENDNRDLDRQYLDSEERDNNLEIVNVDVNQIVSQRHSERPSPPTDSTYIVDCLQFVQDVNVIENNEKRPDDSIIFIDDDKSTPRQYSDLDLNSQCEIENTCQTPPSTTGVLLEEFNVNTVAQKSHRCDNFCMHENIPTQEFEEPVKICVESANDVFLPQNNRNIERYSNFVTNPDINKNTLSIGHDPSIISENLMSPTSSFGNEIDLNSNTNNHHRSSALQKHWVDLNQPDIAKHTFTTASNSTFYGLPSTMDDTMETEEFVMDQLFLACDRDNTGKVRVSDIIEYLGRIMGTSLENDDAVNGLIALLDPDNVNAEIDMDVYRDGLHQWIKAINKNYDCSQQESKNSFSDYSFTDSNAESPDKSCKMGEILVYQTVANNDDRNTTLSSQLLNLQLENQKLSQDKSEAYRIVESRDDELYRLTREMVEQENKYKRLQEVVSAYAKIDEERSELERQLCSCRENYDNELDRNKQLEQEKSLLHVQLSRYKKQMASLTVDLSACRYEKERSENSLLESKERACRLNERITNLEIQLSEKEDAVYETNLCLEQNSHRLQILEEKNKELESQLTEAREELASVEISNTQSNTFSGNNCVLGLKELRHLIEEDVDQPTEEMSVDIHSSSIHNELKDLLSNCNPIRPWPLSEKEIVSVCDRSAKDANVSRGGDSIQTPQNDKDETACYNISNERLRWLVNLMRTLKGENKRYRLVLSAMLSKNPQPDPIDKGVVQPKLYGTQYSSNKDLRNACDKESSETHEIYKKQCENHNGNCMTSLYGVDVSFILRENRKLREEIRNLQRSNVELEDRYRLAEVKVQNLEEEVDETKVAWRKEKQRCADLEDTLCETTLSRQLDLRDIWRLVHKEVEVETEHYIDNYYGFDHKSVETLKKNIEESIAALKCFKENALKSPCTSSHQPPTDRHRCYDNGSICSKQNTPTSPLIEALSIDAVNGNFIPSIFNVNALDNSACHLDNPTNCNHHNGLTGLEPRSALSCPSLTTINRFKQCQCHANTDNSCLTTPSQSSFSLCQCRSAANINAPIDRNGNRNFNTKKSNKNKTDTNKCIESIYKSDNDNCIIDRRTSRNHSKMSYSKEEAFTERAAIDNARHATTQSIPSHKLSKPQPSVGFMPIQKEPTTKSQHHQDPIRKPLANGKSTKGTTVSGYQGVRYSNEKGNSENDQSVLLVSHKKVGKRQGNPILQKENEHTTHISNKMCEESIVKNEHIQGVFHSVLTQKDQPTQLPESTANRPKSLPWATTTTASVRTTHTVFVTSSTTDSCISSSSLSSPCASSSLSSSYTSTESVNLPISFGGMQDQKALWHTRASSHQDSLSSHLFGVPDSIENWDLSPGTGHETPTLMNEYSQNCLSRMAKMENNEEETELTQVDGERIHTFQDTMADELGNVNERSSSFNDNDPQQKYNANKDANANLTSNGRDNHNLESRNVTSSSSSTVNSSGPQRLPVNTTHNTFTPSLSFPDMASLPTVPSTSQPSRIPVHGQRRPASTSNTIDDECGAVGGEIATNDNIKANKSVASNPSSSSNHSPNHSSIDSTAESFSISSRDSCSSSPLSQSSCNQMLTVAITPSSIDDVTCNNSVAGAGGNAEQQSRAETMLVPSSPPSSRHAQTVHQGIQPLAPGRLARIRQNHLATKRKEQMKTRKMKLPEVCENSELELSDPTCASSPEHQQNNHSNSLTVPQLSDSESQIESHDAADDEMDGADANSAVTPTLQDSLLHSLGLMTQGAAYRGPTASSPLEDLSEKEIENKFASLSLAINTDRQTVDQRVCVQERARDLAEQNVDRELLGIGDAVEALNRTIKDAEVREIVHKIRRHIQVLEQSTARVSSRAEVYGAVQQERRLCRAIELMVQYTENLRRTRAKEESDVQEARKIINERSLGIPDFESPSRRSMSVCGVNILGRPMRRRSEVVLPKVLGGIGSPSLTQTSSMENISRTPERETTDDVEDARSRFQSAVASTSMKNAITNTIKRASLDRRNSSSPPPSASGRSSVSQPPSFLSSNHPGGLNANGAAARECDRISESSAESIGRSDENVFRKGYEEGVKAHMSQEMVDLRDQQNSLSNSIDDVVDTVTEAQRQDLETVERPSRAKRTMNVIHRLVTFLLEFDYRANTDMIRYIVGGFLVVLAIFVIYFFPSTFLSLHHFSKPPQ